MKGTAPRHPDRTEDERLGRELLASEKNRAENLMIVDLLRNDLGRLAEPGSVTVDALFSLERYPTVWTMTSTVSARAPAPRWKTCCARCSPAAPSPARPRSPPCAASARWRSRRAACTAAASAGWRRTAISR